MCPYDISCELAKAAKNIAKHKLNKEAKKWFKKIQRMLEI